MCAFDPLPPVPAPPVALPIQPSAQPWQVHTDRRSVNRLHGRLVGVHAGFTAVIIAVVIVLAVLLGDHLSGLALAPFGIVLVGQVFQIGYHCYIWGARSAVQIPLVVSAQGLSFNTARGPVRLPWPAIESMSLRSRFFGRVLVIRPQPVVRVDSPGVEICYPARTWARAVRSGLMLGSRGIHETLDQVAAAITSASDGRVRLR